MTPEEFNAKMKEVLQSLEDQAKVSTILSEVSESFTATIADAEKAKETAKHLIEANEGLRQANMKLFLKLGEEPKVKEQEKEIDTTPKFEDLFNEKGELK